MTLAGRVHNSNADERHEPGYRRGITSLRTPPLSRRTPRTVDPAVPAYTAPKHEKVPELMSEFIEWLNHGDLEAPVQVRASMAHLNLVKVHPWQDGNGRMSRALSTLVFAREALMPPEFSSIEEWLGRGQNTYAYYQVLEQVGGPHWSPKRNTHPWIKFCLAAHHRQAQQAQRRVDLFSRAWTRLAEATEADGLDERVVYALLPAFSGSKVRRKLYQQDAGINRHKPFVMSVNWCAWVGCGPRAGHVLVTTRPGR